MSFTVQLRRSWAQASRFCIFFVRIKGFSVPTLEFKLFSIRRRRTAWAGTGIRAAARSVAIALLISLRFFGKLTTDRTTNLSGQAVVVPFRPELPFD